MIRTSTAACASWTRPNIQPCPLPTISLVGDICSAKGDSSGLENGKILPWKFYSSTFCLYLDLWSYLSFRFSIRKVFADWSWLELRHYVLSKAKIAVYSTCSSSKTPARAKVRLKMGKRWFSSWVTLGSTDTQGWKSPISLCVPGYSDPTGCVNSQSTFSRCTEKALESTHPVGPK